MKKLISVFIAIAMLASLSACGASADKSASAQYSAEAPSVAYDNDSGGFAVTEAMGEVPAPGEGEDAPALDPEKIIFSADTSVETREFEKSVSALEALVKEYNGFVESSSVSGVSYSGANSRRASYVIRIPGEYFSVLMSKLSSVGNVVSSHTYSDNITSQYYDISARLSAYEAQETRLIEMMKLAETVEDIITLEDRLTDVRYSIDSLQSTLNNWDRQVSYSSVSVELSEVVDYTPEPSPSYGDQLKRALSNTLKGTLEVFKVFLVVLVYALPLLVICGVVLAIVIPLSRRKKRKKAAAKPPVTPPADSETK